MSSSDKPIKFELKRLTEVNKDTIAVELRRVALLSPSSQLSIADFGKLGGRVGPNTIRRHFGTWNAALEYAGLEHMFNGVQPTKQGILHRNQKRSDEELLEMLRAVAEKFGKTELTKDKAEQHSEIRYTTMQKRFGSWANALKAAGLQQAKFGKRYTDDECFENLLAVWTHYGRPPQHKEMSQPPSNVGGKAYVKRFGTWNKALAAFVDRINSDNAAINVPVSASPEIIKKTSPRDDEKRLSAGRDEDKREIKLGLRFAILQRDRFRCVTCGASPATHLGCALHVDHILPFSKGGKTLIDNLRTLCASCNIGRGNRFED
jgi:hypothetical protein